MMMRSLICWLFALLSAVSSCAREQPAILVTAEAQWLNPLTNETKRAIIRPLVRIQPADESEVPKTLQQFGGLNWKRWQAASEVTLRVVVRDATKRLSGIEIVFNEQQRKFVPAQSRSELKATVTGNLVRNEVIATVFVHESERTVPKWRLLIHPERRGRPVRFLFELPANFGEKPKNVLPDFLQDEIDFDDKGFFSELKPQTLLQSGVMGQNFPIRSWRWITIVSPFSLPGIPLPKFATAEDKSIQDKWAKQSEEFLRFAGQERDRVFLSIFLEGKVVVRYEATAKVLVEVQGEVGEDANLAATKRKLEKALMSLAPISLLPSFTRFFDQWQTQNFKRNKALEDALRQIAASFEFANLSVRVLAERFDLEPKSIERQLRPVMVTLWLKLQGKAKCDYHRQIHIVPVRGKVRFAPSKEPMHLPSVVIEQRRRLWEGIPDKPIEVNVPIDGAEVQVPFAWLQSPLGTGVNVEVRAKGWRLAQPFRPNIGVVPPKLPSRFTLELEPTEAETAAFLLELPHDAQLRHATIVVQDEQGKVIASRQAVWLDDYGGHGILLTELPYNTYRVAAEGSYTLNGKEQTFSVQQTVPVRSYHFVVWLRVR